jgi:hypothetical protein
LAVFKTEARWCIENYPYLSARRTLNERLPGRLAIG